MWKENQSITYFQCYFHINKEHDHILLVYDEKNDNDHVKVTEYIWKDVLHILISFIGRGSVLPIKDNC